MSNKNISAQKNLKTIKESRIFNFVKSEMEKFCQNQANTSELEPLIADISNATDNYGLVAASIIGILFNVLGLVVLYNKSLKHNFYSFLRCRCLIYLLVCIIGLFFGALSRWKISCGTDHVRLFMFQYFGYIPIRMALLASLIVDNLLILNRLVNLFDKKNSIFYKMSEKVRINFFSFASVINTSS